MLHHRKQPHAWGCLYHALYAVTGDEDVLEHVRDISNARFYARVHGMGLMVATLYANRYANATSSFFWVDHAEPTPQPLLVTIAGQRPDVQHLVAIELTLYKVTISDSRFDEVQIMDLYKFAESEYGKAYRVEALVPAELDLYPVESAPEFLSTADPTPYVM